MQHISIDDVPARERLAYLHDFIATHIAGLHMDPARQSSFDYELTARPLGQGVLVGATRYSAVAGNRARALLADGKTGYVLSFHDTDYEFEAAGRRWTVRAGDAMIVDETTPFRFWLPGTRALIVGLDRARLLAVAPWIAARPAHRFPSDCPKTGLLAGYVRLLNGLPPGTDAQDVADHVYRLVSRLGMARETAPEGIGAARLHLVKADIERRLADPSLGLDAVARRQRVTPRYVQQLFAREGTSFSDHVRARRLDAALAELRDTAQLGRSIADIAFAAGFGDLSSFNRAFRKRFGTTPSELRGRALRERQA
jgi:AraC-like DNA-binding protein